MRSPDAIRLRHLRDAAAQALEIAAGRDRPELSTNPMLALAVVRCLEIVGEAAAKLTPETCAAYPALPVPAMVSMRNRLIHAYFDVDLDIVWTTVQEDLPALLPVLDETLAALGD